MPPLWSPAFGWGSGCDCQWFRGSRARGPAKTLSMRHPVIRSGVITPIHAERVGLHSGNARRRVRRDFKLENESAGVIHRRRRTQDVLPGGVRDGDVNPGVVSVPGIAAGVGCADGDWVSGARNAGAHLIGGRKTGRLSLPCPGTGGQTACEQDAACGRRDNSLPRRPCPKSLEPHGPSMFSVAGQDRRLWTFVAKSLLSCPVAADAAFAGALRPGVPSQSR